ncbi:MAG: N-acetyl-alpha-D-glucosaminyl L-malate synthase BshA [Flavobacteriales bacterium]|nr:N-acetyl-alpha-D-glucosaminyl L-malate synthase BshA [Flavobacteriales bacterium]
MNRKLKIGVVCFPTYGGSGIVATELGRAMARHGHEIHFISYKMPVRLDVFEENVFYHEVSSIDYPLFEFPPYELSLAAKMVDVVKFEKLDILHVHYAIPNAYVAFMAKQILLQEQIRIPLFTTLHGTDITLVGKSELLKPAISFAINQSDYVTAVSDDLKKETCSYFDVKPDKIHVIPNFIDLEEYRVIKKLQRIKKAIAPNGEKLLVHISNFRPVKNIEDVVKVFYEVQKEVPSKLIMVGDGPCREGAEKLCRELNIADKVRFMGKSLEVPKILSVCDLMLLPSKTESFGLVALEAMACSVPVVSTNTGGLPEVNIHEKTGFTLPVGDIEGMAKAAKHILGCPEKLQHFKENALAHAQTFDIQNIVPDYEEVYYNLIQKSMEECEKYQKGRTKDKK